MFSLGTFLLSTALTAQARTLYEAISDVPELSNFTTFYANNEALANTFFANQTNYPLTFLVPSNKAFSSYQAQTGTELTNIPLDRLLILFQYHTLVSSLSGSNFSESGSGLTAPTFLNAVQYNNRSVGESMANKFGGTDKASGQVVFIKGDDSTAEQSRFKLMSRQSDASQISVRSGLSSTVNMTVLDTEGLWDGGRFHVIDGLLTPPDLCKTTIRSAGLNNLDNALNRSGLWPALDGAKNVTCLGPNDDAFREAGSPDASLDKNALSDAILFHTLPEVAYSDYLYDGQMLKSLQNGTVRVKVEGTGKDRSIWFNNAKVVNANVL